MSTGQYRTFRLLCSSFWIYWTVLTYSTPRKYPKWDNTGTLEMYRDRLILEHASIRDLKYTFRRLYIKHVMLT